MGWPSERHRARPGARPRLHDEGVGTERTPYLRQCQLRATDLDALATDQRPLVGAAHDDRQRSARRLFRLPAAIAPLAASTGAIAAGWTTSTGARCSAATTTVMPIGDIANNCRANSEDEVPLARA